MVKKRFTVCLEHEDLDWLEDQVKAGRFSSISHGVRWCVRQELKKNKVE